MEMKASRKSRKGLPEVWPHEVVVGRTRVKVYRRTRSDGTLGFEVANYASGKRRLESFPSAESALDRADTLARQLSEREVLAAEMTNEQAAEYAASLQNLAPYGVSLIAATGTLAECLKLVGDLSTLQNAAKSYVVRNKQLQRKRVEDAVAELLALKEARQASTRYLQDLKSRLNRFAADFQKDASDVTTAEVQTWLDSHKLSAQTYQNNRRVVHLLFEHCAARGYAVDNPVAQTETLEVKAGDTEVFTPADIQKLLAAASEEFLPCLAIGAFAGLRSAEIERLEWSDIQFSSGSIVVGASKAKTASRRVVPLSPNLAAWLAPYIGRQGHIWQGTHEGYYKAQLATAELASVKWKDNALRHSYASYRFALTNDAGRVAGELGNTAPVVHRHYRELVKTADAERWFAIKPQAPSNVVPLVPAALQ